MLLFTFQHIQASPQEISFHWFTHVVQQRVFLCRIPISTQLQISSGLGTGTDISNFRLQETVKIVQFSLFLVMFLVMFWAVLSQSFLVNIHNYPQLFSFLWIVLRLHKYLVICSLLWPSPWVFYVYLLNFKFLPPRLVSCIVGLCLVPHRMTWKPWTQQSNFCCNGGFFATAVYIRTSHVRSGFLQLFFVNGVIPLPCFCSGGRLSPVPVKGSQGCSSSRVYS